VVFELNAPAPSGWDQLFHNVENVQKIFEKDGVQVEVVFFGKGLTMLLKKNEEYAARLKEAAEKGVVLAACQNTMRAMKVKSEDLFPFATEVDSGVAELVRKQEAGFSYIKGGE
jgi:intracellular sulfur oxidation DsrE/DsrF family protein